MLEPCLGCSVTASLPWNIQSVSVVSSHHHTPHQPIYRSGIKKPVSAPASFMLLQSWIDAAFAAVLNAELSHNEKRKLRWEVLDLSAIYAFHGARGEGSRCCSSR